MPTVGPGKIRQIRANPLPASTDPMARTATDSVAERLVDTLSGGERQRVWLAMLLAQDARLLLLDEPISALDVAHQVEVLGLVRRLSLEKGLGVIVVIHEINLGGALLRQHDRAEAGPPDCSRTALRVHDRCAAAGNLRYRHGHVPSPGYRRRDGLCSGIAFGRAQSGEIARHLRKYRRPAAGASAAIDSHRWIPWRRWP